MKVLVTGDRGYLGSVLCTVLAQRGHSVAGLDAGLFDERGAPGTDLRDATHVHLEGVDAVVNLAALCNDACGDLSARVTEEVNALAVARLADLAIVAGVGHFVQASSCSVYGTATDSLVNEATGAAPLTVYAVSKVQAERALQDRARNGFAPVCLRFATLFGAADSFRSDVLVNRVVGTARRWRYIEIHGKGTTWRPLLHVRDAALAIAVVLEGDPASTQGRILNVGDAAQNYTVTDVVDAAVSTLPDVSVRFVPATDNRSYAVSFDRFQEIFPQWRSTVSLEAGIVELVEVPLERYGHGSRAPEEWGRSDRRQRLVHLRSAGRLDDDFRWWSGLGS